MLKKLLIIGLVVIIGLVGIGFLYLNHVWIPKHLKPMVIDILEKNLEKKVTIDKAFYFPFKGVLFSGVNIENQDKTPYLEIDKVDLSLKSFPKIKGKQAALKARLLVKGLSFKQQDLQAKGSIITDIDLEVQEGKTPVFQGTVTLDDLQVSGIENISDITGINGKIVYTQEDFQSQGLTAMIKKQRLNLDFAGKCNEKDLDLEKFDLVFGKTNISVKAKVNDFQQPQIETALTGMVDLSDIGKIVSLESLPRLAGECKIQASANGPLADLDVLRAKVNVRVDNGSVDKIRFSDLTADIIFAKSELNLAPVYCTFYDGKISASAKAKIKDIIPIQCSVDVEQVDIEPLVKDITEQDMGAGKFNAHIGVSGSAMDLNTLTGSGWFKIEEAALKPPPNFKKVAKTLGSAELADMLIEQSSATFSIMDGKVRTEDFIAVSDYAVIRGKGYIDLEQYVDFTVTFEMTDRFIQSSGGAGQIASIAADGAEVKLYDKISQLKYKVDFSAGNIIKNQAQDMIKGLFDSSDDSRQDSSQKEDIKDQLKKGLRNLFK